MEHLPGFAALAERYDGFVLDLWGVIHDGVHLYPGVADTLGRLKALGKEAGFAARHVHVVAPGAMGGAIAAPCAGGVEGSCAPAMTSVGAAIASSRSRDTPLKSAKSSVFRIRRSWRSGR